MRVIEASKLKKNYMSLRGAGVTAVDGLDLVVEGPGVHGFVGPNGSGKTTTIRCLLGLIRPSSGTAEVLGADVGDLHTVVERIGALVETPKFFPSFSGRKNLMMLGRLSGIPGARVDEVLETVGLKDRGGDTYKSYSLGMKQRLAVGATLLKDPDLVILDEPANGLDPSGIVDMRQLIRRLADEGKTVFVSSHQLAEVQLTCDVLTIISGGRVIQTGSVAEVLASVSDQRVRVVIDDADGAQGVLSAAGISASVTGPDSLDVAIAANEAATITQVLAQTGRYLRALEPTQGSLEQAFLELTEGNEGSDS